MKGYVKDLVTLVGATDNKGRVQETSRASKSRRRLRPGANQHMFPGSKVLGCRQGTIPHNVAKRATGSLRSRRKK